MKRRGLKVVRGLMRDAAAAGVLLACVAPTGYADQISLNSVTGVILDNGNAVTSINGVTVDAVGASGGVYTWDVLGNLVLNSSDTLTVSGGNAADIVVANNVDIANGATITITPGTAGGAAGADGGAGGAGGTSGAGGTNSGGGGSGNATGNVGANGPSGSGGGSAGSSPNGAGGNASQPRVVVAAVPGTPRTPAARMAVAESLATMVRTVARARVALPEPLAVSG